MPAMATELQSTRSAAMLLLALGESEAATVLKHLDAKVVQRLGSAMAQLKQASREEVSEVVGDFVTTMEGQADIKVGSDDYIRKVLTDALGRREGQRHHRPHPGRPEEQGPGRAQVDGPARHRRGHPARTSADHRHRHRLPGRGHVRQGAGRAAGLAAVRSAAARRAARRRASRRAVRSSTRPSRSRSPARAPACRPTSAARSPPPAS